MRLKLPRLGKNGLSFSLTTFIMKFHIDDNQHVFVNSTGSVSFHHHSDSGSHYALELNYYQFLNFDDVIQGMAYFKLLMHFPLGKGVWLQKNDNFVKLVDENAHRFFHFYRRGWHDYINNVHHHILSFIRHAPLISHQQSYARDECRSKDRSR